MGRNQPLLEAPKGHREVQFEAMLIRIPHVTAHPQTGRLIFRRQFPKALRHLIPNGHQGVKRSLWAKSLSAPGAMQALTNARAEWERKVAQALKVAEGRYDPLDPPLIEYLAALYIHCAAEDDARRREGLSPLPRPYAAREDPEDDYEESREMIEGRHGGEWAPSDPQGFDRKGLIAYWGPWVKDYTTTFDHAFDPTSEAFGDLCGAVAGAACTLWLETLGPRSDQQIRIAAPTPKRPERPTGPQATSAPTLPLKPLLDNYAATRAITPNSLKEMHGIITRLIAHVGHDDARRLTTKDIRGWRDALSQGLTKSGKQRDPRTVLKAVNTVKTLLKWAVGEEHLETSVAAPVSVTVPRKAKLRERAFTSLEARTILAATLCPAPPGMSPEHRRARRWIPWLCAYSGARVGEIAQVRKADVTEIDGVWAINITPEAGTVKTKEARLVPLHRHLIDQGFLDVAASLRDGPIFYDPAKVRKAGETNRHVKKVGERLAQWVRTDLGITDKGVAPNHGWRHSFKTIALERGIDERTSDAITGHADGPVARTYEGVSLAVRAAAMDRFPRYEIAVAAPSNG